MSRRLGKQQGGDDETKHSSADGKKRETGEWRRSTQLLSPRPKDALFHDFFVNKEQPARWYSTRTKSSPALDYRHWRAWGIKEGAPRKQRRGPGLASFCKSPVPLTWPQELAAAERRKGGHDELPKSWLRISCQPAQVS
jgi:hypothetical protein